MSEPSDNDLPFGPDYWKQRVAEIGAKSRKDFHGEILRGSRFGEFLRAVRELMATLPKCGHVRDPNVLGGSDCDRPATVCDRTCYFSCDAHVYADGADWGVEDLKYAPALRKLQAMLGPEETT